jgi:murein DD-endopeptidase MepM/ murein hydrolase activator NlpD
MPLTANISPVRRLVSVSGQVLRLWHREYHDARLILEQDGDLRYLIITGSLQQKAVRLAICAGAIFILALAGLGATTLHFKSGKERLEDSHKAIYAAMLQGTSDLDGESSKELSEHDMLQLAQTIRERDQEIRQMVNAATSSMSSENSMLNEQLKASGLTQAAIKVIQSNTAVGAFTQDRDLDRHPDPLLRGALVEESAKNRELKDILMALPSQMPVTDFYVTSDFGIRKHPITGRPRFHAGIDLVTRVDDRVNPVKPGRVILARPYSDYGNTVIVRHDRGLETLYAHLDRLDVKEGQEVDLTSVLGMVGNTGASTGKHLHFEVSIGGYPVDPSKVITTAHNVQQVQR